MKYYFGGSEIKSWRDLLIAQHVPTVSLSYVGLRRRYKGSVEKWKISEHYPDFQHVFLDSGAYTLNREGSEYTIEQAEELVTDYIDFANANVGSLAMVSEFDAQIFGSELKEFRRKLYDNIPPESFMPIWHTEYGTEELEDLCSTYELVGIRQSDMRDTTLIPIFNSMVNRYGVRLHGVAITSKDMMQSVAFDSVSSMSWLSPSVYGDTIVWTGRELKRYPKAYKNQARKKHRTVFRDNNFDVDKIENDDSTELLKLSLWSWQKFTESISHFAGRVTMVPQEQNEENVHSPSVAVDMQGGEMRNEKLLPAVPDRRETQLLPVIGIDKFTEKQDDGSTLETPFIFKRSESMRACNTCFLREKCPGFKANANCLYNIPIEVKTRDQLRAVQDALIEMQTQRVLFMQMAEDLEGGYADPNLSSEMDRLQRMIKARQDSEKDSFNMTITATQSNVSSGFMTSLFGQKAADKMRQLDQPVKADDLIKDSEIYEAEVVG